MMAILLFGLLTQTKVAAQKNPFHFFPIENKTIVNNQKKADPVNTLVTYGHFAFISDMEGVIWVGEEAYPVQPNQPTESFPVPASFRYSFVTVDKQFITQEISQKIHPSKKGEKDTLVLAIKKDFEHFIKTAKEAKTAKFIFEEIRTNMIPLNPHIAMSKYEVTYQQYAQFVFETNAKKEEHTIDASLVIKYSASANHARITKNNISWKHDPKGEFIEGETELNHPVVNISWYEAQQFCQWLSEKEANYIYRLPTTQEWEIVAAPLPKKGWVGYANLADSTLQELLPNKKVSKENDAYALTSPVGIYKANRLGIYDIYGNVAEWTIDDLTNAYIEEPRKIIKGGSYFILPTALSRAKPYSYPPNKRHGGIGFRVVREKGTL